MSIEAISATAGRFGFNLLFIKDFSLFPPATFLINIIGSFLIGFLLTILSDEYEISETVQQLVIVGFLGAYTMLSTFEFEALPLVHNKQVATTIIYVLLSFTLGLISVLSGIWCGKKFGN